ncbi:MAG: S41 family peptidase [Anaerolineae bacterium]|nr:S41 family peptidase [Anaerolineae bacterium]
MTATFIDFLGDEFVNRGESPMDMSIHLEPLTYHIVGGHVIVWSPAEGEAFPAGLGPDGAAFTADDPLMTLPAGWSVIALETDPFTLVGGENVDVPIIESIGALNDYSDLSYLQAWQDLYERTRETYPFSGDKNLDWDAIYSTITPLIKQAGSHLDFDLAIASFGSLIPDTHIGYASLAVTQRFLVGGVGIEALAVTDAGEVVVIRVGANTPAERAGITPGAVLLSVDGDPALQVLDETPLLLSSASTPHSRRFFQAATMLQGPVGSQVELVWRAPDGSDAIASLIREFDVSSLLAAFDPGEPGEGVISARMLESGLGYISVRGFAEDVSQADHTFGAELQGLIDAGAQGIIVDVRDNSGGLVQLAMSIAGRFFPDYVRLFDLYYADGEGGFAYRGYVETLVGEPYYGGPVAVLVNQMTGSAGDMFAYALSTGNRAIVVGHTPTGGFTGEVSDGQYTLPTGLTLQIPTGRPVDPVTGETLIEGVGVEPDVRVPVTVESLLSDEDEVLRAAEAALLGSDPREVFDSKRAGRRVVTCPFVCVRDGRLVHRIAARRLQHALDFERQVQVQPHVGVVHVELDDLGDARHAIDQRVAVDVEHVRRARHVAVVGEIGAEGGQQVGLVALVVFR